VSITSGALFQPANERRRSSQLLLGYPQGPDPNRREASITSSINGTRAFLQASTWNGSKPLIQVRFPYTGTLRHTTTVSTQGDHRIVAEHLAKVTSISSKSATLIKGANLMGGELYQRLKDHLKEHLVGKAAQATMIDFYTAKWGQLPQP
jgi:Ni,Fe-hydrogenase I large subunit